MRFPLLGEKYNPNSNYAFHPYLLLPESAFKLTERNLIRFSFIFTRKPLELFALFLTKKPDKVLRHKRVFDKARTCQMRAVKIALDNALGLFLLVVALAPYYLEHRRFYTVNLACFIDKADCLVAGVTQTNLIG